MSGTTPSGEPEHLQSGTQATGDGGGSPRKPRRGLVVGIVVGVVAALLVPLGAFAAFRLLGGGGTQPHDVLPADSIGYFRIDVDPTAAQKVDALRFLRTFPAFEKYTRITDDRADVRKVVVEAFLADAGCDLNYDDDVAPWLGERLGVAVLRPTDGATEPDVAAAVQVSDEDAARTGMRELAGCGSGGSSSDAGGWTFRDGYMIVAESDQLAQRFADAAGERSLADNEQFSSDLERLGDLGVASMWVSGEGLYDMFGDLMPMSAAPGGLGGDLGAGGQELSDQLRKLVDDHYRSIAVAFRFDASYAEIATVVTGDAYEEADDVTAADLALPETTAVAFGFADGEQYVDKQWASMQKMMSGAPAGPGGDPQAMLEEMERQLGLRLPEDIKTLVGDNFTLALDGADLDFDALAAMRGVEDLSRLDLGVRVSTDVDAFADLVQRLQKLATQQGVPLDLAVQKAGDRAIVSTNDDYAAMLAEDGSLADTDVFQTAVRDADEAQAVGFVNFDLLEDEIVQQLQREGGGAETQEVIDNLTKLEAFGVSSTVRDGYSEAAFRITVGD